MMPAGIMAYPLSPPVRATVADRLRHGPRPDAGGPCRTATYLLDRPALYRETARATQRRISAMSMECAWSIGGGYSSVAPPSPVASAVLLTGGRHDRSTEIHRADHGHRLRRSPHRAGRAPAAPGAGPGRRGP